MLPRIYFKIPAGGDRCKSVGRNILINYVYPFLPPTNPQNKKKKRLRDDGDSSSLRSPIPKSASLKKIIRLRYVRRTVLYLKQIPILESIRISASSTRILDTTRALSEGHLLQRRCAGYSRNPPPASRGAAGGCHKRRP